MTINTIKHAYSGTVSDYASEMQADDSQAVADLFAALASLTQNATYPGDIEFAIKNIRQTIDRIRNDSK